MPLKTAAKVKIDIEENIHKTNRRIDEAVFKDMYVNVSIKSKSFKLYKSKLNFFDEPVLPFNKIMLLLNYHFLKTIINIFFVNWLILEAF